VYVYQPEEAARRWVLIGDGGLYLAEFVPTVENPLAVRRCWLREGRCALRWRCRVTLRRAEACGLEEGVRVAEALLGMWLVWLGDWGLWWRCGGGGCS